MYTHPTGLTTPSGNPIRIIGYASRQAYREDRGRALALHALSTAMRNLPRVQGRAHARRILERAYQAL